MNGGLIGQSNRPQFYQSRGIWTLTDVELSRRIGQWPLAIGNISVAIGQTSVSPRVSIYPWSSGGFGTKYANPSTLPAGSADGIAFSPSGSDVGLSVNSTPFVSIYPWSSGGFGTLYANPATLPTGGGNGIAF